MLSVCPFRPGCVGLRSGPTFIHPNRNWQPPSLLFTPPKVTTLSWVPPQRHPMLAVGPEVLSWVPHSGVKTWRKVLLGPGAGWRPQGVALGRALLPWFSLPKSPCLQVSIRLPSHYYPGLSSSILSSTERFPTSKSTSARPVRSPLPRDIALIFQFL